MSRQALLVLGMHRGGTSATAGLLAQLGVQPPATLMPADAFNPQGYWESKRLWSVHEGILRQAGSRWDSYSILDVDRFNPSSMAELMVEARDGLRTEFDDAAHFVIKDPRVCRFVPFWLRVLKDEGVAASAVLVLRNPLAVAQSLAARDRLEPELSLLIWLRHMLDAERHTRDIRRSFVRYEDLVQNWRSVGDRISRDIDVHWRSRSGEEDEQIGRFVQAGLQHHRGTLELAGLAAPVAEWLRRTSSALDRLHDRDSRDVGALAELDAVRRDFDRTTAAFAASDRAHGTLQRRVEDLEQDAQALRMQVGSLDAARSSLQEHVAALEHHSATLQGHLEAAQEDRMAIQRHLDAVEQDREKLRRHAEALEEEQETLRRYVEVLERDRTAFEHAVSEALQDARALRQSASWRMTAPLRALYRLLR